VNRAIENALLIAWMKFYPDFSAKPYIVIIQAGISGSPLFFFLIAGSLTAFSNGVAGAMVAIVSFIGLASSIQDISQDRYIKIREMMIAMPVHPASYAFGIALAPLLMSMPGLFSFIALAIWLGLVSQVTVFWVLLALMLCWASTSMLGFIISTHLTKLPPFTLNTIARLLSLTIIFLPPVYYSETALGPFGCVSYLFPTSNAACLIRAHLGLSDFSIETLILHWLILVGTTVSFVLLACFRSKWRED
jgi:hypothetical protein